MTAESAESRGVGVELEPSMWRRAPVRKTKTRARIASRHVGFGMSSLVSALSGREAKGLLFVLPVLLQVLEWPGDRLRELH